ncbi:Hypothetical protein D9617_51g089090 [Elsinoe fawcettii]|nr:Hypothetical protein D9617_51g089090 [Elsinoe fawcettii]
MPPDTSATDTAVKDVHVVMETAIAWSNLPEDELIIVFAPYDWQSAEPDEAGDWNRVQELDEALSRIHPGEVRLVGYRPGDGITTAHRQSINQTATILVIVGQTGSTGGCSASPCVIEQQLDFSEAAMSEYHRIHEGTEPDALILLYCGEGDFTCPPAIQTCLRVRDHSSQSWNAVASKLLLEFRQ